MIFPDLWQQEAVRALVDGRDVVVQAPTGAGKTHIFEMLVERGFRKRAVYTVPTRALANDKLMEWRARGWDVGICTGDVVEKPDAKVVVATLETQKGAILRGEGPGLLVIDEYQMLADSARGVNYELAIAMAPPHTQLLLMSGSVANPQDVQAWLNGLGRRADCIVHRERPVPQEEVFIEGLKIRVPQDIRGYWPRIISKALAANLGPVLIFAPHRSAAEAIAKQLNREVPIDSHLLLTDEQRRIAGRGLSRMLKNRIAYHHSGLSYLQRAGVIEPLAKAGQLRVVVATMGLASGINFSLRAVCVADNQYRTGHHMNKVRPDELLQMFGRAGRRGLDTRGYLLVVPEKPRLHMASALKLRRVKQVDWPSLVGVMQGACEAGKDPLLAVRRLTSCLFQDERISLGLEAFLKNQEKNRLMQQALSEQKDAVRTVAEFLNTEGLWERRRAPVKAPLGEILIYEKERWVPALSVARTLKVAGEGNVCLLQKGKEKRYGREIPLAKWSGEKDKKDVVLSKWLRRKLNALHERRKKKQKPVSRYWYYDPFERIVLPQIPQLTGGGKLVEVVDRGGTLYGQIDYSEAAVFCLKDRAGRFVLGVKQRQRPVEDIGSFAAHVLEAETGNMGGLSPVQAWFRLGLIDYRGRPTRRGQVFSFFNYGEGLAIAAALEDESYEIENLVYDLANLRGGHRFEDFEVSSGRLGKRCRSCYGNATFEGYLEKGLPLDYGDGAAEVMRSVENRIDGPRHKLAESIDDGDVERVWLEWISLLRHVARAPDCAWDRWCSLRACADALLLDRGIRSNALEVPPLAMHQRARIEHRLRW